MSLEEGTSDATLANNMRELKTGATYRRTRRRLGKRRAEKQRIAIALNQQRRSARKSLRR
jgi:hypothetical protein